LADCEAALGKLASALGHYNEYVGWVSRLGESDRARHAERVALASAQVEALKPRVPTLELALSASAPAGMIVERDGVALQGAALGVALPVDPGEHVIVTRSPGEPEVRTTLRIELGEAKRLELPLQPKAPAPPAPAPAPVAEPTSRAAELEAAPSDGEAQRTLGYVAGGVGIAGLVVGAVTGLLVLDRKATVDEECVGHICSKDGKRAADSGQTLAAASTIAFGVGVAGLATGVALVLTAPADPKRAGAWLGVTRRF
ncbi:MAG TPA: hypothetical protein VFZ53_21975, partial [Polyangiaceae bacterium]